jgi:hypothetical protein
MPQAIHQHQKPAVKLSLDQSAQTALATGAWVKAQRLAYGLSQARLAIWMGYPYVQQSVSQWERHPEQVIRFP